jgi:hypothetical protein
LIRFAEPVAQLPIEASNRSKLNGVNKGSRRYLLDFSYPWMLDFAGEYEPEIEPLLSTDDAGEGCIRKQRYLSSRRHRSEPAKLADEAL